MSNKASERIPTLSNIVKTGDPSMENHFDGQFIEEIQEPDEAEKLELDQQTINDLVNDVIHTTMPIIERQLRNQLSGILKKYEKT